MDAKRLVMELHVREGRVVDPGTGADLGLPDAWARRVELEGADEALFTAEGGGLAWVASVARSLFIPFSVRGDLGAAEARAALAAGADRVLVPAGRLPGWSGAGLARACAGAFLPPESAPPADWSRTLEALEGLREVGEVLLGTERGPWSELFTRTAHLPFAILVPSSDPAEAGEALAWGADGAVFQAGARSALAIKDLLAPAGVQLRR